MRSESSEWPRGVVLRAVLALLTLLLTGCPYQIQGPTPHLASVQPRVVCTEQLTTRLSVTGDHLTPLPIRTLAGFDGGRQPQTLRLPAPTLLRTFSLDGMIAPSLGPDGGIPIYDDYDQPALSHVSWASESQMTLDTYPELRLQPGVYDLAMTNPDGQRALLASAIAAVPPPTLTRVEPVLACIAQADRTFTLTGTGLLQLGSDLPTITVTPAAGGVGLTLRPAMMLGCTPIATSVMPGIQSCTGATFVLAQGAAMPGLYNIQLTNPTPANCRSTQTVQLFLVPPPHLTVVAPPSVCVDQMDQVVSLTGTGFLQLGTMMPSITVTPQGGGTARTYAPMAYSGCTPTASEVQPGVQSCTGLTFTIPRRDLMPGTYTVQLTNPAPADCHTTETVTLVVTSPPTVTGVTPMTICQGGGTLTVSGTGFQNMAGVTLGTTMSQSVMVSSPTMLTATFGGATAMFTPGQMLPLTVRNPDGCSVTVPNAVTVVAGPVLFFADPPVVYNGITTQVTLYSTSVRSPLMAVRMRLAGGAPLTLTANIDPAHANRILATIPSGTPAGSYDLEVVDGSGCPTTLSPGVRVVSATTLNITSIDPPFGWQGGSTAVTLNAAGGLLATPRVYLNPHTPSAGTVARALSSVAFVSATRLTAIVPQGVDPASNPYDVIVVNPDGTVGVLTMPDPALYRSVANPPPLVDSLSPSAVPNTGPPPVTLTGQNFRMPTVTFNCVTNVATGTRMSLPATVTSSTATSITIGTPPVSALSAPTICTLRVTNSDGSYGDYVALAVSNSSGNLSASVAGPNLPAARRAPALLAANATRAARFLYAVGGDNGASAGALDSVVSIDTNENGYGAAWSTQRYRLNRPRTLAGYASLGRYLYVVGGNDGTGPVGTVERALVLDPLQAPSVTDVDITPGMGTGLGGGIWTYRVAAQMPMTDTDNPGGETLPSDVFPVQLPDLPMRLQVRLTWSAVPGASGYLVYRSPTAGTPAGQEVLLATVTGGATVNFTDTGASTMTGSPLPLGSTGRWATLATLGSPREAPAAVFGVDPASASTWYLYAILGRATAGALGTYELLPVTLGAGGQQSAAAAWIAGTQVNSTPRSQHSAYAASNANASFVPAGNTYVYVGGGTANGTSSVMSLESARVTAGGQLTAWSASGTTIRSFGHGATLAANYLYSFGDEMPSTAIRAGQITSGAAPAVSNFNNNGGGLVTARYLPGVTQQTAYIFVVGGSNSGRAAATNTVESMLW